jgi:hypothetical protein
MGAGEKPFWKHVYKIKYKGNFLRSFLDQWCLINKPLFVSPKIFNF